MFEADEGAQFSVLAEEHQIVLWLSARCSALTPVQRMQRAVVALNTLARWFERVVAECLIASPAWRHCQPVAKEPGCCASRSRRR